MAYKKRHVLASVVLFLLACFCSTRTTRAQPQAGLNVTGAITQLIPNDASVIPANTPFLIQALADATNHENFVVAVSLRADVNHWNAQKQVWEDVDPGLDIEDEQGVLPKQTAWLGGNKTMNGLPHGTYKIVAVLDAWVYDIDGKIISVTPIAMKIHYFTVQ